MNLDKIFYSRRRKSMKKFVKLVNIHDGNSTALQNGERLYVETFPRAEKIISAFLSQGWELDSRTQRYNPAIQESGNFSFYLGGWDLLFIKEAEDDEKDDGDEILERVLAEVVESTGVKCESDDADLEFCEEDLDLEEEDFGED